MKISWIVVIGIIAIAIIGGYFIFGGKKSESYPPLPLGYEIPKSAIHWHPWLKIVINGEEQEIPSTVGSDAGALDTGIGTDMGMSPIHTHEGIGETSQHGRKIHVENLYPSSKPRTLTLGYFFDVWGKKFNRTCIFEYCNSGNKTVKIFVNDKPNYDFENFYMRDGDRIEIRYE